MAQDKMVKKTIEQLRKILRNLEINRKTSPVIKSLLKTIKKSLGTRKYVLRFNKKAPLARFNKKVPNIKFNKRGITFNKQLAPIKFNKKALPLKFNKRVTITLLPFNKQRPL